MKYLLSTGEITSRFDEYILDLVKLYTTVYPGDIPGTLDYGFDFLLTNVMKEDLESEVSSRVKDLIGKIKNRFVSTTGLSIELVSVQIINETRARIVLNINNTVTGPIEVTLTE